MDVAIPLIVILVMVVFNAFYVAAEFATVGSRRSRVQEAAESGSRSARGLFAIMNDPAHLDNYVAACQVGITLSSLVAGAYGQGQLTPLLEDVFGASARFVAVLIVLAGVTTLQVVLGELLPKTVALRYPERLAIATLPFMRLSQVIFRPFVAIFNGSAIALLRWRGVDTHGDGHARTHTVEELASLYRASAAGGLIEDAERDMLAGVLAFDDRLAREIMTPRRRLTTLSGALPVAEALREASSTVHSRFPVDDETDDLSAIVHLRDLYRYVHTPDADLSLTVADVARTAAVVPEVLTVPRLWRQLRDNSRHTALVVNEYGSVTGLVTLEDVVEEIFGEVLDEFDLETEPISVDGDRVSVRGDVLIEAVNDRFGLQLPDDDVGTIGGLVWHQLEREPEESDVFTVGDVEFRVDQVDGRQVERASFALPQPEDDAVEEADDVD